VALSEVAGIGMGVPGLHRSAEGICLFSPNFAGWTHVDVVGPVRDAFGIATYMLNDVKTATLGEHRFGAGRGYDHMVMITLGTGIGGGVISDGQLRLGSSEGFSEVGHMVIEVDGPLCTCGNRGCWEALAGRDAIVRRMIFALATGCASSLAEATGYDQALITPALIGEHAAAGDALASQVWEETMMYVGVGVVNLVTLYNPQVFVIGGGIAQAGDMLFAPVQRVVNARAHMVPASSVRIVPAALGEDAAVVGGASLVLAHME
jgi:glucokinase